MEVTPYTPLTTESASIIVREPRDIEIGPYLSVQDAEAKLNERKVEVIRVIELRNLPFECYLYGTASVLIVAFMALSVTLAVVLPSCPENDAFCVLGPLFLTPIGASCLCTLSLVSCCLGLKRYEIAKRKKQLSQNAVIDETVNRLTFKDDKTDPLECHDFIQIEPDLGDEEVQKLSFAQLKNIKDMDPELFKKKFSRLSIQQKGPWNKIELIKKATPKEFSLSLNENYIKTRIETCSGFLDELIHSMPDSLFDDEEAMNLFLENIRNYLRSQYDYHFSDKQLQDVLYEVKKGAILSNCFEVKADDQRIEILIGLKPVSISKKVLSRESEFFAGLFRKDQDIVSIQLDPGAESHFEILLEFLMGKELMISESNVEFICETANYFIVPALLNACEPRLLLKYLDEDIDAKLDVLERYPLLSGRFKRNVDSHFSKSLAFEHILENPKPYLTALSIAKQYKLIQSLKRLDQLLCDEISQWIKSVSRIEIEEYFMQFNHYFELSEESKSVKSWLVKSVFERINSSEFELKNLCDHARSCPILIINESLIHYIQDKKNSEHVEGLFISVQEVLDSLKRDLQLRV